MRDSSVDELPKGLKLVSCLLFACETQRCELCSEDSVLWGDGQVKYKVICGKDEETCSPLSSPSPPWAPVPS